MFFQLNSMKVIKSYVLPKGFNGRFRKSDGNNDVDWKYFASLLMSDDMNDGGLGFRAEKTIDFEFFLWKKQYILLLIK